MKCFKAAGRFTRGRGLRATTIAKYIKTGPTFAAVSEQLESFCNVYFVSSEQHTVDSRLSRITKDAEDLQKLLDFMNLNNPFIKADSVICIATGVKGNASVNCHEAFEIGSKILKSKKLCNYAELSFQKKDYIISLAQALNTIKVKGDTFKIDKKKYYID